MSDAPIERLVLLKLPRKLAFLLEMHPYKIAYSGRNGLKSRSYSAALLTLGLEQRLRIMCVREIQETLRDSSHQLLVDQIQRLNYTDDYAVTDDAIRCRHNGTLFRFRGLSDLTAESAKALEGLDIVWADEMQAIRRRSFQIMLPTLFRTPNAEFWGCFNPNLSTDESWERFVVHPPPGAVVVEMNYRDAIAAGCGTTNRNGCASTTWCIRRSSTTTFGKGAPEASCPARSTAAKSPTWYARAGSGRRRTIRACPFIGFGTSAGMT
jgi:hypothetical protein